MSNPQHEPTMEEILASIRKIISEDQPEAGKSTPQPAPEPMKAAAPVPKPAEPDVLELTEEVVEEVPAPAHAPAPPPIENDVVFEAIEEKPPAKEPVMDADDLISDTTRSAVGRAFASLDGGMPQYSGAGNGAIEAIFVRAVQDAFAHPGRIDPRKVDAQQARRILDRLVGYRISPILWKRVQPGLSAGRVQSVAVRLIVEREREIRAFEPVEYWSVEIGRAHV